jgi:hypothetical protein
MIFKPFMFFGGTIITLLPLIFAYLSTYVLENSEMYKTLLILSGMSLMCVPIGLFMALSSIIE